MPHADLSGSWQGLQELVLCVEFLFTDPDEILDGMPLPLMNNFVEEGQTLLRNALLLALSTVRARNGGTPARVASTLLNFAENNDNSPIPDIAALIESELPEDGDVAENVDDSGPTKSVSVPLKSYDDSHYCAVLLLALSRVRVSTVKARDVGAWSLGADQGPPGPEILLRIRAFALEMLDKDSTLASAREKIRRQKPPSSQLSSSLACAASYSLSAGGILTTAALQCLCEMDIQGAASIAKCNEVHSVDYRRYLKPTWPALVRRAALECCVRLEFARYVSNLRHNVTLGGEQGGGTALDTVSPVVRAVQLVCDVIEQDPNHEVTWWATSSPFFVDP